MSRVCKFAQFENRTVPDVIAPGLRAVFCGINPSLSSAAAGVHFATPGNRFWPTLHHAGLTPRRLRPDENRDLLALGFGVTNLVARATAAASGLSPDEYPRGVATLAAKCATFRPLSVAVLGVGAFRVGFRRPKAVVGPQDDLLGSSRLYVLPNPSGLNAHYTPVDLATLFRDFGVWLDTLTPHQHAETPGL